MMMPEAFPSQSPKTTDSALLSYPTSRHQVLSAIQRKAFVHNADNKSVTAQGHFLVVDDEPGIRELLSLELQSRGHIVATAANGEQAMGRIREQKYDVVISDVMMPKLDGLSLTEAIKRALPDTELIVMTGFGNVDTAVQAMKKGAFDFIQKPFNLNDMMALIETALKRSQQRQQETIQEGKLAQLGKMTASIIHDLKNPIGGIALLAQMLLENKSLSSEQREDLETILHQSRNCGDIVQDVLRYSRRDNTPAQSVSIAKVLEAVLKIARRDCDADSVNVTVETMNGDPCIQGYAVPLQQVFLNLITNARQAMRGRKEAVLKIRIESDEKAARILFSDTGCGIPAENLEKIFDPFFTSKSETEGTGLGLYICRDIVSRHGGHIRVSSTVDVGTVFTLEFPKSQAAAEAA